MDQSGCGNLSIGHQTLSLKQQKRAKTEANKELFAGTVDVRDELDGILERFGLRKAMRVCVDLAVYAQLSPSAEPTNQWTAEH